MHIIWGIIGIAVGFLVIKYSVPITDNLGRIEWAEQYLRSGLAGTYSMYRLAGVLVIIFSLLYMFGGIGFILGPLSTVFGGAK